MVWLILALLVCVALGCAVLGMVAVPARREGRQVLTAKGEKVVSSVTDRTDKVATRAKGAGEAVAEKVRRDKTDKPSVSSKAQPAAEQLRRDEAKAS